VTSWVVGLGGNSCVVLENSLYRCGEHRNLNYKCVEVIAQKWAVFKLGPIKGIMTSSFCIQYKNKIANFLKMNNTIWKCSEIWNIDLKLVWARNGSFLSYAILKIWWHKHYRWYAIWCGVFQRIWLENVGFLVNNFLTIIILNFKIFAMAKLIFNFF